jgi:hypothetical protein
LFSNAKNRTQQIYTQDSNQENLTSIFQEI